MTVNDAVPVFPALVPVTVCDPTSVAEQLEPEHVPFGLIVNVVEDVKSPRELFDTSNPSAVKACATPA